MKKIILSLLLLAAGIGMASAQYDYSSASRLDSIENALASANSRLAQLRADSVHQAVWRTGRYFNVGYSIASTSSDVYNKESSKYGFFLSKGTSYVFPRKTPIGGVLKLGFDVRWFDLQFASYGKFDRTNQYTSYNHNSNSGYQGWVSDMIGNNVSGDADIDCPRTTEFNHMSMMLGALGVGPTLTVAPLTFMDNQAASLRLNLYFHYQPTFGCNLYHTNTQYKDYKESDLLAEMGYVNMFDWGFKLQWKTFGLGMECRWGSGKLNNSTFSPETLWWNNTSYNPSEINVNGAEDPYDGRYTRKFAETRIYLDFVF
ncbi:MAG: hypothetical protein K2I37_00285 [Muribaculaceae bacterium]|nr:hypothetical protein [Muribaculaceae bacterium]